MPGIGFALPEAIPGLAGGDIYPARFIMPKVGTNNSFVQCTAAGMAIGISPPGPKGNQVSGNVVLAAEDGDQFCYYPPGASIVELELADTVEAGWRIMANAVGLGVPASAGANNFVGALAIQGGVSGDRIPVYVTMFTGGGVNPAPSSSSG